MVCGDDVGDQMIAGRLPSEESDGSTSTSPSPGDVSWHFHKPPDQLGHDLSNYAALADKWRDAVNAAEVALGVTDELCCSPRLWATKSARRSRGTH
jgi:hypothetical protein